MFIMVFSQLSFYYFTTLFKNNSDRSFSFPEKTIRKGYLFYLGILWFLGTWTIPTFVLFEISLLVFFGLWIILKFREEVFNIYFPYTQIMLTLILSLIGFYFQYFIFIPDQMLATELSTAATFDISELIPGILDRWIYPFIPFRYLFILLAIIGLFSFYKKDKRL